MPTVMRIFYVLSVLVFLSGCGGDGSTPPPNTTTSGEILYGHPQGITYVCSSGFTGYTDANGSYSCDKGDNVAFYISSTAVTTLDATDGITTPYELFPSDTVAALNFARLIQALNLDGSDNYEDIDINTTLAAQLPADLDFSSPTFEAEVLNLLGITLIPLGETQIYLNSMIIDANGTIPQGSHIPVANAGEDQSVTNVNVVLDGSQSYDLDDDPLRFKWSILSQPIGSNIALSNPNVSKPSFTAALGGTYSFGLIVNDGIVDSPLDTVDITFGNINTTPIANAGSDQNVKTADVVDLNGSGSFDTDGDALTYLWNIESKPAGSTASLSANNIVSPQFTADINGTYVLKLIVNDGTIDSQGDFVNVVAVASAVNSIPNVDAGANQSVDSGDLVLLSGSANDADGDSLTYLWAFNEKPPASTAVLQNATTLTPSFTADIAGNYVLSLVANDGTDNSLPSTVSITATAILKTLKKTGQTTSYRQFDDGYYGSGELINYTSNVDVVLDTVTQLTWQKNRPGTMNSTDAVNYCANLNLGAKTDWRLPTAKELYTLVDRGRSVPAIDTNFETPFFDYWSTSSVASGEVRVVDFYYGDDSTDRTSAYHEVRCVRGTMLASSFQRDATKKIVTDTTTRLMWQDNTTASTMYWSDAIDYCEGLSLGGFTDWRLPNINELLSVSDFSNKSNLYFSIFNYNADTAWSSTTNDVFTSDAFSIENGQSCLFLFCTKQEPNVISDAQKTSFSAKKRPKCVRSF